MKRFLIISILSLLTLQSRAVTYNVTVPGTTKVCYIAGEFSNWSHVQMNCVDGTHYTLDIPTATASHQYKYCSGPSWTYVENRDNNRTWSASDVVTSWAQVYDPGAVAADVVYTVEVPRGTTVCYFAGAPTGWVHKQMARVDETHFRLVLNTRVRDNYKYCAGPDWAFEEVNSIGQKIPDRTYQTSDVVVRWQNPYYYCPVGMTYNVAVPSDTKTCYFTGEANNWDYTPMVRLDESHYMINLPNGNPYQPYKYTSGPGEGYVEKDGNGNSVGNRSYKISDAVASWTSVYAPTASLTLTSDFSGRSFEIGSVLPIRWTAVGVQNVNISITGDYGLSWSEVASAVPASSGQFDLTLPEDVRYQCKIRITDASNNQITETTPGMFVIYNHLPAKVEPLLRANFTVFLWPYNSQYPVTNSSDSEFVNGRVGNACGPTAVANIMAYWEFPRKGFGKKTFTDSHNCVWSADFAESEYNYDLVRDNLLPNSPQILIDANARLMYHAGVAMHNIYRSGNSWDVMNGLTQHLGYSSRLKELCRDDYNPEQWEKIMKSELSLGRPQMMQGWASLFSDGNYAGHWYMCDGYNEKNEFHVNLDYGGAENRLYCPLYSFKDYGFRNWIFAYLEPEKNGKTINLISPAGEENWQQSSEKHITWTSTGVSNVRIEFSDNGGATWTSLIESTPAAPGGCDISLPQVVSSDCKIRVTDAEDINIFDRNRTPFQVYDTKSLEITSIFPTNMQSGVIQPIRWIARGLVNVSVEYTVNDGAQWNPICEVPASQAVCLWTVPAVNAFACKIRVMEKGNTSVNAVSSAFGIVPGETIGGPYAHDDQTMALYHFNTDFGNLCNPQSQAQTINLTSLVSSGIPGLDNAARIENTNSSGSSCMALPHESGLSMTGSWTIEFWFKINSWGGSTTAYPYMFIKPGANYFVFLEVASRTVRVGWDYQGGAEVLNLPNNSLETNKWYHLIYTRNTANSTMKCELRDVNRQLLKQASRTFTASHTPKTNTDPIQVGGFGGGSNVQFDGLVDEIRISNVVRTFTSSIPYESLPDERLTIWPNPASGTLHIGFSSLPEPGSVIRLLNTRGQVIHTAPLSGITHMTLDISRYPAGIYIVQTVSANGMETRRLVVE
jgi:hypothetical protein